MYFQKGFFLFPIFCAMAATPVSVGATSQAPATERVFNVLNLNHPGLADVKKLHEAGRDDAARRALHEYIRTCKWERRMSTKGVLPNRRDPHYSDPIADDFLKNIFHLGPFKVCWGPSVSDIQWYEPPMHIIDDVHLFYGSSCMTRHDAFLPNAAKSYWHTLDERYAARLAKLILDFIKRCPIVDSHGIGDNELYKQAADENGDGKPDRPGCCAGMVWQPFNMGRRMYFWHDMFIFCKDSESFTMQGWCEILCSIHEQVDSLVEKLPAMGNRTNHTTLMGQAVLEICDFWPEMANVPDWRRGAIDKLSKTYNWFNEGGFVYPDGADTEITDRPDYAKALGDVIETARTYGISVGPNNMLAVYEKTAEFAIASGYPDDIGSNRLAGLGKQAAALCGRKDLLHIATGGKEGRKPDFVSWPPRTDAPSYAGTYYLRSGWDRDGKILRTRFGPIKYSSPLYGSGSMGEICLFACGMHLIPFINHSEYRGEFKDYGNAGFAGDGRSRNTISVDGVGQTRYGRIRYAEKAMGNPWITSPVFDYVRGSYTFDPKKLKRVKMTHTRSILFARPDYYVAIDRLLPADNREHEYRMKYQLNRLLEPQTEHARATAVSDKAGIVVEPLRSDIKLNVIKGQKEPYYEGWHYQNKRWYAGGGTFEPAPSLIYTWKETGVSGMETLFYPFFPKHVKPDQVRATAERAADGAVVLKITGHQEGTTDYILIGGKDGGCKGGEFELRGTVGFARVSNGKLVSSGIVEGALFQGQGWSFTSGLPASAWFERQPDGTWQGSTSREGTIKTPLGATPTLVPWKSSSAATAG